LAGKLRRQSGRVVSSAEDKRNASVSKDMGDQKDRFARKIDVKAMGTVRRDAQAPPRQRPKAD
jgi:hypothetical protein